MAFGCSNEEIFDKIYATESWGKAPIGESFYSGPGTYHPSVTEYVALILNIVASHAVKTILEIGCGDFVIGRKYAYAVDRYLGVDVSANVIAYNSETYSDDRVRFARGDAAKEEWGSFDLCVIRQVFQHLSNGDVFAILERTAQHKLVLVTEHVPAQGQLERPNLDKRAGPDTRVPFHSGVYVDLPPFSRPAELVLEAGDRLRTVLICNGN